jgi:hypothetical protein
MHAYSRAAVKILGTTMQQSRMQQLALDLLYNSRFRPCTTKSAASLVHCSTSVRDWGCIHCFGAIKHVVLHGGGLLPLHVMT